MHMLDTAQPYSRLRSAAATKPQAEPGGEDRLQPDCGPAGIKGVRNVNLEKSIMNPGVIGAFIPIVAITFGIGIGCLAIWSEHKRKLELIDRLHRERMLALEKGVEPPALPPGMLGDLAEKSKPKLVPRYLWPKVMRNGLALLFGGVVLYFAVDRAGGAEGAVFMLIPAVIGLANLIYAAVLWQQERNEPSRLA
jgi:hypothetical protein